MMAIHRRVAALLLLFSASTPSLAANPSDVPSVATLAALRSINFSYAPVVYLEGTANPNDGIQGNFWWGASSTCTDDAGVTCVKPTAAGGTGRWVRFSLGYSNNGININPNGSGGALFNGGTLGSGNGVVRTDSSVETQNTTSSTSHVGVSLINNNPAGTPEQAVYWAQKNTGGTVQTGASGIYATCTGQHTNIFNTNSTTNAASWYAETIGIIGGNPSATAPLILGSNNSAWVLSGQTSSLYLCGGSPPPNFWHNIGFEQIDGGVVTGLPQAFTGTPTSGSNVITSVTPDPTAAATFVPVGAWLGGVDLPNTPIVTGTTSNSITFSGGNAVGSPGAETINVYPGALTTGYTIENTGGYTRTSTIQGSKGTSTGFDVGNARGFFDCDVLNGSHAYIPCALEGSSISLNIGTVTATPIVQLTPAVVSLAPGGGSIVISTARSPASGAACAAGDLAWDTHPYLYICSATGVWGRVALTTGY